MNGAESQIVESSRDGFTVWRSDPAVIAANIVTLSEIPIERLRRWVCPCCDECKAVFAQDDKGSVWFGATITARGMGRDVVIRLDSAQEIAQLVKEHPCVPDRILIAVWLTQGLYDELARLFGS
jgi:hypothetical protein